MIRDDLILFDLSRIVFNYYFFNEYDITADNSITFQINSNLIKIKKIK